MAVHFITDVQKNTDILLERNCGFLKKTQRWIMPKKILVIDDEEILTITFVKLLEKAGYSVLVASRGEDAVIMAEEDNFDLIICDIRMPGQDGVSTMRQIKELRGKKETPVIFITGYADETLEKEANRLDPVAYIYKPFDAFKLLDIIKETVSK